MVFYDQPQKCLRLGNHSMFHPLNITLLVAIKGEVIQKTSVFFVRAQGKVKYVRNSSVTCQCDNPSTISFAIFFKTPLRLKSFLKNQFNLQVSLLCEII